VREEVDKAAWRRYEEVNTLLKQTNLHEST